MSRFTMPRRAASLLMLIIEYNYVNTGTGALSSSPGVRYHTGRDGEGMQGGGGERRGKDEERCEMSGEGKERREERRDDNGVNRTQERRNA